MSTPRFRFGPWTVTVQPARTIREIHHRDDARRLVEAATEQLGRRAIRDLLGGADGARLDDDDAERALAQKLLDGKLVVVIHQETPRMLDAPQTTWLSDLVEDGPGGEEPLRPKPGPKPTFVAFRLLDEDGTPLAKQPFSITLPDGRTVEGTTDAAGHFEVDPLVTPGSCTVRFGELAS